MSDSEQLPSPPTEPRRVAVEFRCVSCGYIIRGIGIDSLCPECGTPIAHSIGGNKPTSGKAIAALVLGIVSILGCTAYGILSMVCGPLAIIFANGANKQIATGSVSPGSKGLAKAGLICGIIGTCLGGLWLLFLLFMIAAAILHP